MPDAITATKPTARALPVPARVSSWTGYAMLLRWNLAQIGAMLPLIVVVQALLGAGIIIGFGFLIPGIDVESAKFLSTGAPTVLLMVMGLVMVSQGVAQARTTGTFTYLRALPVPRPLLLFADLTVWLAVSLPSVAVALLVAHWRYGFDFSFDWPVLLLASTLTAVTASAVGYALALALPPMLTQLVTQVLVFFVMLFSPITFHASQLPEWFQTVHDVLPFRPAADLLRAGMLADSYRASGWDLAVLCAWCVVGFAVSLRAVIRRA